MQKPKHTATKGGKTCEAVRAGKNLVVVLQFGCLSSLLESKTVLKSRVSGQRTKRGCFLIKACFALLIANIFSANAQDYIILKNGAQIKAKVIEINFSEIKYKLFENPDGPTQTLKRNNVFVIDYPNGYLVISPIQGRAYTRVVRPVADNTNKNESTYTQFYAEDIIVLKNGQEIKAKVTEITLSEIKYKLIEQIEGPTRTVAKNDVFIIIYENGTREIINSTIAKTKNTNTSVPARQNNAAIGANLVYGTGGFLNHIGIGAKFHYNVTNFIRFAGEFGFFPKKELQGLDINGLSINVSMWDFSVYGHLVLSGEKKKVAFYPLAGLGMTGYTAEVELDLGVFGKASDNGKANDFVFTYGGGLELNLSSNIMMNLEFRNKRVNLSDISNKVDFSKSWRTNFVFGLAFKF